MCNTQSIKYIKSNIYILGDFHLHLDMHSSVTTMIDDILTSVDMTHVTFSTHIRDNWHDLLITRSIFKKTTVGIVYYNYFVKT